MTVENAIDLFDVREKQALAFCTIYKEITSGPMSPQREKRNEVCSICRIS